MFLQPSRLDSTAPPRVLVVVIDDVAQADVDELLPALPNLAALAAQSMVCRRAYSHPVCGVTRYTLQTGEWGRRRGIIHDVGSPAGGLPTEAVTMAEAAGTFPGARRILVGKWHCGGEVLTGPLGRGYDSWRAGTYLNLRDDPRGSVNYTDWFRLDDGAGAQSAEYATKAQALAVIEAWNAGVEAGVPLLALLCLNAPHGPLHTPPPFALPPGYQVGPGTRGKFEAMLGSVDVVLGLLAANLLELDGALVVVSSDNGTSDNNLPSGYPMGRSKGTTYERGVRVPLLVRRPGGAGAGEDQALRSLSDVWSTVAAHLGSSAPAPADSLDLLAPAGHDYVISEAMVGGEHKRAVVRSDLWKLLGDDGREEFYDLGADPGELTPVPASSLGVIADELRELLEHG